MSAQIIERWEGQLPTKDDINGATQVSFNDSGHLVVRFIRDEQHDVLIVFDQPTSRRIIAFCRNHFNPDLQAVYERLLAKKLNEIPF